LILTLPYGFGRPVNFGNEATAQKRCQRSGVNRVGLDLRFTDQPRLEWMCYRNLYNLRQPLEQVEKFAPVPARFQSDGRYSAEAVEKLRKTGTGVALNSDDAKFPALLVLCCTHAIAVVHIDASVVHLQFSFELMVLCSPSPARSLLSSYLTPFSPFSSGSDFGDPAKIFRYFRGENLL
jgi:hypothetical protein